MLIDLRKCRIRNSSSGSNKGDKRENNCNAIDFLYRYHKYQNHIKD